MGKDKKNRNQFVYKWQCKKIIKVKVKKMSACGNGFKVLKVDSKGF
jgi:hypothetical protein